MVARALAPSRSPARIRLLARSLANWPPANPNQNHSSFSLASERGISVRKHCCARLVGWLEATKRARRHASAFPTFPLGATQTKQCCRVASKLLPPLLMLMLTRKWPLIGAEASGPSSGEPTATAAGAAVVRDGRVRATDDANAAIGFETEQSLLSWLSLASPPPPLLLMLVRCCHAHPPPEPPGRSSCCF